MAERARRRHRLVRAAVAAAFVVLAGVATAVGVSRHQAATARDQARVEALRAEAGKSSHWDAPASRAIRPPRSLTRAAASVCSTRPRRDGLRSKPCGAGPWLASCPSTRWFGTSTCQRTRAASTTWPSARTAVGSPRPPWTTAGSCCSIATAGRPAPCRASPTEPARVLAFGPRSDLLVTGGSGQSLRFWSLPDLREIRTVELGGLRTWWGLVRGDTLLLGTSTSGPTEGWAGVLQAVPRPDGRRQRPPPLGPRGSS